MAKNDLAKKPILTRINEFDDWSSRTLSWSIQDTKNNDQKSLALVIDSYGGEVYSLMGMIDIIKNSGLEIITIASAKAMSCGAFLLSFGKKRYATENSTIMLHGISGTVSGDVEKTKNKTKEIERLHNKLFEMLDKNTNQQPGFWINKLKENNNNDLYLSAQQAKDWGLVTDIGVPTTNEFFEEKTEDIEEDEDFEDLILLLESQEKNNTYIKSREDLIEMDLSMVMAKLSDAEKKPIDALKNDLISAKAEVESKTKAFQDKELELKAAQENHLKELKERDKKSDEDFVNSLIQAKKLSQADKADELEILASLSGAVKDKQKTKLLARKSIVEGEIPDHGEGDFNGETDHKIKIEAVAKKHKLDLSKMPDLLKAQSLLVKEGG